MTNDKALKHNHQRKKYISFGQNIVKLFILKINFSNFIYTEYLKK